MAIEYSSLSDIRKSLILSTDQVATRLGVTQSSIVRAEQSERKGTISLALIQRYASALGMEFQYKFVPTEDPDEYKYLSSLRNLSLAEKLHQAMELSEVAARLKNAPKRPR